MIAHYPKSREYAIMRVSEDDAQWLSSKDKWTREQKRAKRFYHKDSAEWALVLSKIRDKNGANIEEALPRPNQVKTTWSSS